MKKSIFILPLILLAFSCSQEPKKNKAYFEGLMAFENKFTLKTNKFRVSYLDSMMGHRALVLFKEGNYYEVYDKGMVLSELYKKNENKVYIRKDLSDTLHWINCEQAPKEMESFQINPKKDTILGIVCDEYITRYKNKTATFYFSSDTLNIDPEWFAKYTLGNKHINSKRMSSMYLKYVIEYPDFIVSISAVEINPKPLHDSLFVVDPKFVLVKDADNK